MRNLELYYHADRLFSQFKNVQHFCVNPLENTVFILDDGVIYCVSQNENAVEVFSVKGCCPEELKSEVVSMCYNSVLGALCLATKTGDLLTVMWTARTMETVGSVPQGLRCLQWSPDEELMLLVTGGTEPQVLVMTLSFDPLWEQPLHQAAFGEKELVTVGWGSKTTQFHGSEGKAAARAAPAPTVASSPRDDGSVRVSWRGDGSLVAVSSLRPDGGARCIRIFSRDGVLQATSEAVPGLEMTVAWRPSGNIIASTQVLPNKYQVAFFEKNGLRHGEFILPFSPGEGVVRQLAWNTESDVLSVWYEDDSDGTHLLLCTVNNYHWYVKQRFSFSTKRRLLACAWDPEERLKLHVVYGSVQYAVHEWIWTVCQSSPYAEKNRAEVAVIDGNEVLLTAFAEKIVPPPLCAERLDLPCSVNQVVFGPPSCANRLLIALTDGRIALFEGHERSLRWVREVQLKPKQLDGPLVLHHWLWVSEKLLVAVATEGLSSRLVQVELSEEKTEDPLKAYLLDMPLEGSVLTMSPVGDGRGDSIVVQTADGDLLLVHLEQPKDALVEPLTSVQEKLLQVYALPCNNRAPCIVGLSARGRLLVDAQQLAGNATSLLLLQPDSLLFTTSSHTLLYLHLPLSEENGEVCASVSNAVTRRVERGSRLVTAAGAKVVLQMPRGNLETLTPRALVLQEAARELDEGRFAQIFSLFRKQRINLNLLVDHNPALFMERAEDFVRDIQNPTWLSLLAVELTEEDVTKTAYADSYHSRLQIIDFPWPDTGKRAAVCTRLCEAMDAVVAKSENGAGLAERLLLPRLSALAVGLGDLEAALQTVSETEAEPKERALKHLLTLCDARALYRAALALYDFRLAALVAARSNQDPKEYLPFLNELLHLDEDYRCYRVDAHLGRWPSALAHLAHCSDRFEEFLTLMQKHLLYSHALTLFSSEDERYRKVAALYGEYLLRERKLEEAAVMLRRAQLREDALEACRMAGDWQQTLVLLAEMKCPAEVQKERLHAQSTVLLQQRRFQEAAHLLYRHCSCAEEAVSALCQGRLWAEAELVATEAQRRDLLEQVKQGVAEHCEQLLAEVGGHRSTYEAHLKRLRFVRVQKLNQPEEREADACAESDLYSDTSSTSGSGSYGTGRSGSRSGRSSRSGKNRRKQERKLLSLKEGAPYEDLALLRAMHQITTTCFALRKEVHALCLALLSIQYDTEAATLQRTLASALQLMEESRAEVWPPELTSPNAISAADERYGPEATVNSIVSGSQKAKILFQNCELLEPLYRIPPQIQDHLNWKLSVLNT